MQTLSRAKASSRATLEPCSPRAVQPSIHANPQPCSGGEGALPALLARRGIAVPGLEGERRANGSPARPGSLAEPGAGAATRRIFGADFAAPLQPRKYTWSDKDQTVLVD